MDNSSLAIVVSSISGFAATLVTQYFLSRKDRMTLALQAKREEVEAKLKLERQRAEIARLMTGLTAKYLVTRQRELGTFEHLISERDFDELQRLSHNLKGTGASFGYPEITRMGAEMEHAIRNHDMDGFTRGYEQFAEYIRGVPAPAGSDDSEEEI